MRDFLLRLLGSPRPIHLHIDPSFAALARPGDTLLICPDEFAQRSLEDEATRDIAIAAIQKAVPGINVVFVFDSQQVNVIFTSKAGGGQ